VSGLILPYQPLNAADCNVPADALEGAIRRPVDQGVRSRLPQAVKLLRAVAAQGAYPSNQARLLPIANAIKAGFGFTAIANPLPRIPNAEVLDACRRAVRGLLTDHEPTPAHRAQTQLQFGCVLAEAGLSPAAVQPVARKVPDYVVDLRGLPTAIEVKLPASPRGSRRM
jgi:hypothetical protein